MLIKGSVLKSSVWDLPGNAIILLPLAVGYMAIQGPRPGVSSRLFITFLWLHASAALTVYPSDEAMWKGRFTFSKRSRGVITLSIFAKVLEVLNFLQSWRAVFLGTIEWIGPSLPRSLSFPPFPQPPPLLCSLFALCLTCSPLPRSRSVCHQTVSDMWSHFHASRWPFLPSYIPIVHPGHADCISRVFL